MKPDTFFIKTQEINFMTLYWQWKQQKCGSGGGGGGGGGKQLQKCGGGVGGGKQQKCGGGSGVGKQQKFGGGGSGRKKCIKQMRRWSRRREKNKIVKEENKNEKRGK